MSVDPDRPAPEAFLKDAAAEGCGKLTIDLARRRITRDGAEARLSPKEYGFLAEAHGSDVEFLQVVVRSLRQKLGGETTLIRNEPGVGYRLG